MGPTQAQPAVHVDINRPNVAHTVDRPKGIVPSEEGSDSLHKKSVDSAPVQDKDLRQIVE